MTQSIENDENKERSEHTFNERGQILTYKDSNGNSYEYTYDDQNGKELTCKCSDGYWRERTYDENGNELTFKDPTGYWVKGVLMMKTQNSIKFMYLELI